MQSINPTASIQQKQAAPPIYRTRYADLNTIANPSPSAAELQGSTTLCMAVFRTPVTVIHAHVCLI